MKNFYIFSVLTPLIFNRTQQPKNWGQITILSNIRENCDLTPIIFLAEQFAERFDGFSIGSNDLTQLVLGIDRDSAILSDLFNERDEAVTTAIA